MTDSLIRRRRLELGLSQQQLAFRAECSIRMIGLLERGREFSNSQVRPRVLEALFNEHDPAGRPGRGASSEVVASDHAD